MHHFPSAKSASNPKEQTKSKSFRRLAHDDVLQLSLHHHEVDELDLRHLSAPKAGATVDAQYPGSARTSPAQCPKRTHAWPLASTIEVRSSVAI